MTSSHWKGSGSISNHLVMPRSKGLFHAAVMESGPPAANWVAFGNYTMVEEQFANVQRALGCAADAVECMRNASSASVLASAKSSTSRVPFFMGCRWAPTVDHVELMGTPAEILADTSKPINDVPTIIGTNTNEGTLFATSRYNMSAAEFKQHVLTEAGPAHAAAVEAAYPLSAYVGNQPFLPRICSRTLMGCFAPRCQSHRRRGKTKQPHQGPLGAVACCSYVLLTSALLVTSSHSKVRLAV